MGTSNLPPGVNVSNIPGNRPEDEAWEKLLDEFWSNYKTWEFINHKMVEEIVEDAIKFGLDKGKEQAYREEQESKHLKEIYQLDKVEHLCGELKYKLERLIED